jgi:hypothetical protein
VPGAEATTSSGSRSRRASWRRLEPVASPQGRDRPLARRRVGQPVAIRRSGASGSSRRDPARGGPAAWLEAAGEAFAASGAGRSARGVRGCGGGLGAGARPAGAVTGA